MNRDSKVAVGSVWWVLTGPNRRPSPCSWVWWAVEVSNRRPQPCEWCALDRAGSTNSAPIDHPPRTVPNFLESFVPGWDLQQSSTYLRSVERFGVPVRFRPPALCTGLRWCGCSSQHAVADHRPMPRRWTSRRCGGEKLKKPTFYSGLFNYRLSLGGGFRPQVLVASEMII